MAREYPVLPKPAEPGLQTRVIEAINKLLAGRGNNVGTFTLDDDPATTTTVTNNRVESGMTILLSPMTLTAATCDAFVSDVNNGNFVVTHLPALATATFRYVFRG